MWALSNPCEPKRVREAQGLGGSSQLGHAQRPGPHSLSHWVCRSSLSSTGTPGLQRPHHPPRASEETGTERRCGRLEVTVDDQWSHASNPEPRAQECRFSLSMEPTLLGREHCQPHQRPKRCAGSGRLSQGTGPAAPARLSPTHTQTWAQAAVRSGVITEGVVWPSACLAGFAVRLT